MSEKKDLFKFLSELKASLAFDSKRNEAFVESDEYPGSKGFYKQLGKSETDDHLNGLFLKSFGYLMSESSLKLLNRMLKHKAKSENKWRTVHRRVAKNGKKIIVNMGNGSVMMISPKGIDFTNKPPARFEVNNNIGVIVRPDLENGDLNILKKYLLVNQGHFKLILTFLFNCFFTDTHYVMLVLFGPAGSAKSFITRVTKTIADPSRVKLRNHMSSIEDLVLSAMHSHLIDINNVSRLSDGIQDTLCTILTGGTRTTRTKYTNVEETVIHTHNPIVMNGISDFVTRDDLYERSIIIPLVKVGDPESEVTIKSEKQLLREFKKDLPVIMGGFFNALKDILNESETFEPTEKLNRMADFHILGLVAERALGWKQGSFTKAYNANIAHAQVHLLENSKVAQALIELKSHNTYDFEGTYNKLLDRLKRIADIGEYNPRKLSAELDRVGAALLNLHDIKITKLGRRNEGSCLKISFS